MTENGQQREPGILSNNLSEYRNWLAQTEKKIQESFNKALLSLSGGALGVSFVFFKDLINSHPISDPFFLLFAWISWALSSTSVLYSYYLSRLYFRRAISKVDDGTIYDSHSRGKFTFWTRVLNIAGICLFLLGVISITIFVNYNLILKRR